MNGINKVILVGRLGRDPELKDANGTPVCSFSLATSESWGKDDDKKERTEWHRIVAWRDLGTRCAKYLKKGRLVYVEGRIQSRKWRTQENVDRVVTEIVARDVQFLDSDKTKSSSTEAADEEQYNPRAHSDEDMPF